MNNSGHSGCVLRFGIFELEPATGELRKSGARLKLQSQHFALLELLASRPGQVVTREAIRTALWDDQTFVDFDRSINFCVNQIRHALDDDPQRPRYIETVPRKGYRFIATVTVDGRQCTGAEPASAPAASPAAAPRWRHWPLGTAAAMVVVCVAVAVSVGTRRQWNPKPIDSLAVLPLENLSHDPEQEYFAEGMTDQLITDLAKISALRVISRSSVMRYKGTKTPIPEIARQLNVDAVLEGTVTRDRDRVRITAQLIRAAPERHLWAENYEAGLSDVISVQDEIASGVAHAIQITLTQRERSVLAKSRPVDPAAYEAYLKGRYLWELSREPNLVRSREYLEKSIEIDPGYAQAWAGLADTYARLAHWGVVSHRDAFPRARAAAEKALELDDSLVEPLATLGDVKTNYEWDWAGAEKLFRQAISLRPNYGAAHHLYATFLAEVGRNEEAIAEARRAQEVDPLSRMFGANVIWKLYLARRYGEAESESRKLSAWSGFSGSYAIASVYLANGRPREAITELRKDVEETHHGLLELMYLGHALGASGPRAEAEKVLAEMQALSERRYVPPMYIAIVYEGLGERRSALQWFERAVADRSINGWILPDPRLDQIRTEPRFQDLMRRMGLAR